MNINFIYLYPQFFIILLNVCVSYYTKKKKEKIDSQNDLILTIMDQPINI